MAKDRKDDKAGVEVPAQRGELERFTFDFLSRPPGAAIAVAIDRAHRIGQNNAVTYVDLIMKGTIDATIFRMLRKKQELAARITGDQLKGVLFDE